MNLSHEPQSRTSVRNPSHEPQDRGPHAKPSKPMQQQTWFFRPRFSNRVALCAERPFKLLEKKLDIISGGQRTHHAYAKDLACKRTKTAGDFDACSVQKAPSHFRFMDTRRYSHRVQGSDSVLFRNMKAQPHSLDARGK